MGWAAPLSGPTPCHIGTGTRLRSTRLGDALATSELRVVAKPKGAQHARPHMFVWLNSFEVRRAHAPHGPRASPPVRTECARACPAPAATYRGSRQGFAFWARGVALPVAAHSPRARALAAQATAGSFNWDARAKNTIVDKESFGHAEVSAVCRGRVRRVGARRRRWADRLRSGLARPSAVVRNALEIATFRAADSAVAVS